MTTSVRMTRADLSSAAPARPPRARIASWLRGSRWGLFVLAMVIGVGAGFGAVAFRYLVTGVTWLATGRGEFGQGGHQLSSHLPWLGQAFYLIIPVLGGLLYGPLVYRFAREARGHGVPEVMVAVSENGGRIRPQVSVVKALASALTIGTGGSVGREGPIVQIGSAMASTLGQRVRVPESRLRMLVACGAGGAIAATFNAPVTGVFFALEIILRELAGDALFAIMLSAMVADAVAVPMLGAKPFLSGFPRDTVLQHWQQYLLVAVLAVLAALLGQLFRVVLYGAEDLFDRLWGDRPEWLRPAVGGVLVGLVLLALPQMFGVGYPVMFKALAGHYAIWFLVLLVIGKMVATSLTLGIGGSGGVFAPSLFIGLMAGTAYGMIVGHLFGPAAGDPALYAAVGMAGVFCSSTRAPLTALASVVEMTGDFTLTLPMMLTAGISTVVSRAMGYGTIYTTKLLRRGQDIERTAPWRVFSELTAAGVMRRIDPPEPAPDAVEDAGAGPHGRHQGPAMVFETESVTDVLRHLETDRHDRLPVLSVLSEDGSQVVGSISGGSILHTVARQLSGPRARSLRAAEAAAAAGAGTDGGPGRG